MAKVHGEALQLVASLLCWSIDCMCPLWLDLVSRALGPYSPINLSLSPNTDVHVFSSGVGPLLSNLEDPELRRLSKSLPATVLRSRKDWTTKTYLGAFQRWKT